MTRQETVEAVQAEAARKAAADLMSGALASLNVSAYVALRTAIRANDPRVEALYRLAREIDALVDNLPRTNILNTTYAVSDGQELSVAGHPSGGDGSALPDDISEDALEDVPDDKGPSDDQQVCF